MQKSLSRVRESETVICKVKCLGGNERPFSSPAFTEISLILTFSFQIQF